MAPGKVVCTIVNGSSVPDLFPQLNRCAEGLRKEVTVCYAGALGLGQPIEDIIEVATATAETGDIKYLIVGEGVRRGQLEKIARQRKLGNIEFTGGVTFEKSLEYLSQSDMAIVSLINTEIFKCAIPSKFFDCMALGLPIILGVDGEARQILEANETGLYYRSGNWQDLKDKILYLKSNPDIARRLGQNGRKLVFEQYRRSKLASDLEAMIKSHFGRKQ
jgi:glycosyltransferase involved in cell wall biosynthesis